MNRNKTVTVIVSIVVVVLAVWGVYYLATRNNGLAPAPTNNSPANQSPGSGAALEPGMPSVSTKSASFISQSTAVLNGDINPNGVQTSYWYEYGETNALGKSTARQLVGGGYVAYSAPAVVSGLK